MSEATTERVIIEEFVRYGEDLGFERGLVTMARRNILNVMLARGIEVDRDTRERIELEESIERLAEWHWRASTARSASEVFEP